ncbi:unnamed protein product, partial [Protopolystoma xenopodis]
MHACSDDVCHGGTEEQLRPGYSVSQAGGMSTSQNNPTLFTPPRRSCFGF